MQANGFVFSVDMPRPFSGNDRRLGTTKWAPAAPHRVVASMSYGDLRVTFLYNRTGAERLRKSTYALNHCPGSMSDIDLTPAA